MGKPYRLALFPTSCGRRKTLYKAARPAFISRYGKRDGVVAFEHAKNVAEEVARYTAKSKDKHWAGMCVVLAALHPFDRNTVLPKAVLQHLSREDEAALRRSFLNLNTLRAQDEAPLESKDFRIYKTLLQPYESERGFLVLPPEAFVRVIDMSEIQFFSGRTAQQLHKMTSHGRFPEAIEGMAHSMVRYWRPAAVQLLLFSCYDKQSNIIARYLHPELFKRVNTVLRSLKGEIGAVKDKFSRHIAELVQCAEKKGIPIIKKTERETGDKVPFILRQKTAGSATLKLINRNFVPVDATDFDTELLMDKVNDLLASTLVSMHPFNAEALYSMITNKDRSILAESEPIFYPNSREENGMSHPDYKGVGHLTYDASHFGAENILKVELHVRSFTSDHDYYHGKAARGYRDSPELADAWGDQNFKIVQALGLKR